MTSATERSQTAAVTAATPEKEMMTRGAAADAAGKAEAEEEAVLGRCPAAEQQMKRRSSGGTSCKQKSETPPEAAARRVPVDQTRFGASENRDGGQPVRPRSTEARVKARRRSSAGTACRRRSETPPRGAPTEAAEEGEMLAPEPPLPTAPHRPFDRRHLGDEEGAG